ncbi:hypothetical protein NQ318_000427 [Aromia moschata]|uniref:Uncharacterized protein n=1 Tax=Aromia moschata TaxID=1265417 RepID=A0AAV8YU41_9CUCU|nr:hypothetical protein NQ318_000427 [Aromia moschata]
MIYGVQKKVQIQDVQEIEVVKPPVENVQRILDTVQEEETLPSGRFSRCGSARRKKIEESPRPTWRR